MRLVGPALVVGVVSSLLFLALSAVAERLLHVLWHGLPEWLGLDGGSAWWTLLMLTVVGLVTGLIEWKIPYGPDPATRDLVSPPLPVRVLPGMALAACVMLAGGPSLGPENPIISINIGLAVALGARFAIAGQVWAGLAIAGTIGALFGTPVAAALMLSEAPAGPDAPPLWDRLFAPLVAAGAGAFTAQLFAGHGLALKTGDYVGGKFGDVLVAAAVAAVGALLGIAAVYAFPHVHRLFHRVAGAVPRLTLAGIVLGLLGMLGGQITLFKGLSEMQTLVGHAAAYTAGALALVLVVKVAALVISGAASFVGGHIFPGVFIGAALGLLAHALIPAVSATLAIASGILGVVLALTQQGWVSVFTALAVVPDLDLLPIVCLAVLPVWLLVAGRPAMLIKE
ncbi:ion channel protein [Streptosporangiaceae bacterium NEAU-GS5]|nr:ion channel protein [Streptosporangiaceae bacterium NEAU-GS5]